MWRFAALIPTLALAATARADAPACTPDLPPDGSPLRRLTVTEFDNTVRDLLGDDGHAARHFPEEGGSGFDNNAHLSIASRLHAQKYMAAAEEVAGRAVGDLAQRLGCDPVADERGCVGGWIGRFGARAFRRPLTAREQARLWAGYARARRGEDVAGSVRLVLQAILQSPHFLYRIEGGQRDPRRPGLLRLEGHDLAARLSYFLWGTMPDDELFRAAGAGELRTAEQVAAQARRMLADPRARATVRRFYEQWLELRQLDETYKERKQFPDFAPDLVRLFRREFERFVDEATWSDGRLETLLTSPALYVNGRLARFYGVGPVDGDELVRVDDPERRAGILTLGAFLATHAKSEETSPIKRGVFVREHLLCQIPPPPPDNVNTQLPRASKDLVTLRERLEEHRADVSCSKCHALFDPLGLAFESYDAAGRFRTSDNGRAVDATGKLIRTDVDGEFADARELAQRLAQSQQVRSCVVRQWFRFAYGRTEAAADACTLATLERRFDEAGHDVRALMLALTQTDAFLYRRAPALVATKGDR